MRVHEVVGEVRGRTCVLVDDMIDTAGTIVKAADALFEQGAAKVIAVATHGVLSGPAVDRLKDSRISEVVITNSLPVPKDRQFDQADPAIDCSAAGSSDQRGVQRRFSDEPV